MKATLSRAAVFAAGLVASFAAGDITAQLPPGWVVAASFDGMGTVPPTGSGGLYLIHPRTPGMPIAVGGLSSELTGIGVTANTGYGANAIAALPDGDVLVGDVALGGETLDIHRIRLQQVPQGWVGNLVRKYAIGAAAGGLTAAVHDIEMLPGNRVLFTSSPNLTGPMSGNRVGTLDLVTGAISPIPVQGPRNVNALAVSEDAQTFYVGEFNQFFGRVWSVPPTGGTASWVNTTQFPGGVMAIDRDNDGNLVVGTIGSTGSNPFGTPPNLHVIDIAAGTWTSLANAQVVRNGLVLERNTGMIFTGGPGQTISLIDPVSGQETQIGSFVSGVMAGLAQLPAIDAYGQQTGGSALYEWQTTPSPDGLPLLGELGFAVTLDTGAQPLVGIAAFSLGRTSIPNLPAQGVTLLLDPVSLNWSNLVVGTPPFRIALPIPNLPPFAGVDVFGQTFHLDSSGAVSSPGIRMRLL